MVTIANIKAALLESSNHPDYPEVIEYVETHISALFLTENFVYKLKKPVNFGFLDFSTLDRRFYFCNEELRLNRRYSPDIYLGLAKVTLSNNTITIDGDGDTIDFLVKMKRLPNDLMLEALITQDDPNILNHIKRVGATIARLHASSPPIHNGQRMIDLITQNWQENFHQTLPHVGTTINKTIYTRLEQYVFSFLDNNKEIFLTREQEGYFRDTHGDLHSSHICCTDPIAIFDCIEFNQRFRLGDTLSDLAFLLMDLDHIGRRDLTTTLLNSYCEDELSVNPKIDELILFYKIYRAYIRGKVLSFMSVDTNIDLTARQSTENEARSYFNLAAGYLSSVPVILTCGLMGSGKSTLAKSISRASGAEVLCSDQLRKELFPQDENKSSQSGFQEGIYSQEHTKIVYETLMKKTLELASSHSRGVIVDASFGDSQQRQRFVDNLNRKKIPYTFLHLHADIDCLLSRLTQRQKQNTDWSDGRPDLLNYQIKYFDPLESEQTIEVDSQKSIEYNTSLVLQHLGG